jgi:hypothetical protein
MYRRGGNKEDPWISPVDHTNAVNEGLLVYGENNYGYPNNESIQKHDGADVYIRMKTDAVESEDEIKANLVNQELSEKTREVINYGENITVNLLSPPEYGSMIRVRASIIL